MKIGILTQYYPPETGAPQNRLSDLARRMASAGHEVTVLTAKPNYPTGRIRDDYRGGLWKVRQESGVTIIHCWLYPSRSKRIALRLANHFSFVVSSAFIGAIRLPRADFLLVESPPLFLGLTAWLLSRLKGARLIFNVSDLYPHTAVALGYLRPGAAARALFALEALCYRSSVLVTGQTEGIVEDIRRRFPTQRVLLLTNGIDAADFASFETLAPERREDFVVGYAGVLGHAQGLSSVVSAAGRLQARSARVRLEFFGDGPLREELEEQAAALGLANLRFFGHRPRTEIVERMKGWDAGLVPLVNVPLMAGALPSKLFEVMAASVPVLLFAPQGEASRLVEAAGAGICAEPENEEAIAAAIDRLSSDRELARRMGDRGRRFVLQHFDRARIARCFMSTLETVMAS